MLKRLFIIGTVVGFFLFALGFMAGMHVRHVPKVPSSAESVRVVRPHASTAPTMTTPVAPASKYINIDVLAKIAEARELLAKEQAGFDICHASRWGWVGRGRHRHKQSWTVSNLCRVNTLVAAVHRDNGQIELVRVDAAGNSTPAGFDVDYGFRNGINTEFMVTSPPGYIVLGIKRAIRLRDEGYQEVVYTPYSRELFAIAQVREAGNAYLSDVIQQALARAKNVQSRAFPGKTLAEVVPVDVAISLSIIEHVDPARFLNGKPIEELVGVVLTTIGANKADAYRYAVSPAGARGLFQFIPSTYGRIKSRYREARLDDSFVDGMNNHVNAALASFCLFDSDLSFLDPSHRSFLRDNSQAIGRYLAASYNGGCSRAASAISRYGEQWCQRISPQETRVYVDKFDAAWTVLFPERARG